MSTVTLAEQRTSQDVLATSVVTRIRGLIHGNGASRDDLKILVLDRSDRPITLLLDITVGWASDNETLFGATHPRNSEYCADLPSIISSMESGCGALAKDPDVAASLAATVRSAPASRFRRLQDGFKIRDTPLRYHYHEMCGRCNGRGVHSCDNPSCIVGKVTCSSCNGDGKRPCYSCVAGRVKTDRLVRNHDGSTHVEIEYKTCRECNGTARSGYCSANGCLHGRTNCPSCEGTMRVDCKPCNATGAFTYHYWTWLKGSVQRSCVFSGGDPDGFKASTKALRIVDLPGEHADTTSTNVSSRAGACRLRLDCLMPHVHAVMTCRDVTITLDAVGRDGSIPLMPTFLDDLLKGFCRTVVDSVNAPAKLIKAVQSVPVSLAIFSFVCEGGKFDPARVTSRFAGAVSAQFVMVIHGAADRAYDALGHSRIRIVWKTGMPAALLSVALIALYSKIEWRGLQWGVVFDGLLSLLPLGLLWLLAGFWGLRDVKKIAGSSAARLPRQGRWPWLCAMGILGLHYAVIATPLDAGSLSLPFAGRPLQGDALNLEDGIQQILSRTSPEIIKVTDAAALAVGITLRDGQVRAPLSLTPSQVAITDSTQAPNDKRGAVRKIESDLANLGFYSGTPDGTPGSAKAKRALEALLDAIPDYDTAHIKESFRETVDKVLANEIRLDLPADRTMAAPLGNMARANLNYEDVARLEAATNQAALDPGQEKMWRGRDGEAKGWVVMKRRYVVGRSVCGQFLAEVTVKRYSYNTGVELACLDRSGWRPVRR